MKKNYTAPEAEIIYFDEEDIIMESVAGEDPYAEDCEWAFLNNFS